MELAQKYVLTSNRERGFGRYDIMLEPKDKKNPAFIIEFKVLNLRRENKMRYFFAENLLNHIVEKGNNMLKLFQIMYSCREKSRE